MFVLISVVDSQIKAEGQPLCHNKTKKHKYLDASPTLVKKKQKLCDTAPPPPLWLTSYVNRPLGAEAIILIWCYLIVCCGLLQSTTIFIGLLQFILIILCHSGSCGVVIAEQIY